MSHDAIAATVGSKLKKMKKAVKIETKTNLKTLIILIFGGIGFSLLSYYMISVSQKSEFPQIAFLILGIFFGIFGILAAFSIWQLKKYEFDGQRLVIKSIFNTKKKVINKTDIVSFNEIEKENKSGKWKDLTIFTLKHKEKISSSTISNYYQLKSELTKGIKRDEYSEKLWLHKNEKQFGIAFLIIGLLFSVGMLRVNFKEKKEIQSEELTTITVSLTESPEFERRKSSKWISLKTAEYPNFNFEITGTRFRAAKSERITSEITNNDQINIDIFKESYEKKISKTKELGFWDKTVNFNQIIVNGLRYKEKVYLALDDINSEEKKEKNGFGFWVLFLVGIGITISGIYLTTRKKPAANNRS